MNLDLQYLDTCPIVLRNGRRDWSLGLDFKILLKTPWAVRGTGR